MTEPKHWIRVEYPAMFKREPEDHVVVRVPVKGDWVYSGRGGAWSVETVSICLSPKRGEPQAVVRVYGG